MFHEATNLPVEPCFGTCISVLEFGISTPFFLNQIAISSVPLEVLFNCAENCKQYAPEFNATNLVPPLNTTPLDNVVVFALITCGVSTAAKGCVPVSKNAP